MKEGSETVKVVVRCRPLNSRELADGRKRIVEVDHSIGQVLLRNPEGEAGEPPKVFTFDKTFNETFTQRQIFDETAKPIIDSVLEGYNGTIFAYGQTGTGKTHTMEGAPTPELQGIIPNAFEYIFTAIQQDSANIRYMVHASFLEIYNEEIRDLLSKDKQKDKKLDLKEHKEKGVYVSGLNSFVVESVPQIRSVLEAGKRNRSVGATLMNQDSSRSHSIFTITIETIGEGEQADGHVRVGKLNLVDLAGSERQSKTGATGDRLKEATKINLSLSALGNVIGALSDGKSGHIPYRDSKLTRLLQDSLGGNTKTVMVANVGPADWNFDETMSTLRYANRAKNITNKPRINEDPKDAMIRDYQETIIKLKQQLEAAEGAGGGGGGGGEAAAGEALDGPEEAEQAPEEIVVEKVVEKVVEVPKRLEPEQIEQLRADFEQQARQELQEHLGAGVALTAEQVAQVEAEAEERAGKEVERLELQRERAKAEAAKYESRMARMAAEMAARAEAAEKLRSEKAALAKKLRAMEGKLLKGEARGGLLEVTRRKEEEIARREAELRRCQEAEGRQAALIAELEGEAAAAKERWGSRQEEVDSKARKLAKIVAKVEELGRELDDLACEQQGEREELLDSLRQLRQQMQLKDLVIDAFIPAEEVHKVMRRAHWDEEREVWVLERLSDVGRRDGGSMRRPVSAAGVRRPVSDFAKAATAAGDMNPRFRSENILSLELDLPERTTCDFEAGVPEAKVQAAIDAAFADDGELLMVVSDTGGHVYSADALEAVEQVRPARPGSALRHRPPSASPRAGAAGSARRRPA